MFVFSYTFKDFIDGIEKCNINEDTFITDYLINNNINFIKNKKKDKSIIIILREILAEKLELVFESERVHETIKTIEFDYDELNNIIDILNQMNEEIINNHNVKKFKNYRFNCRIINKRDSLSSTMDTVKAFYEKLESYNKDEIKGFSFAILDFIEEIKDGKILIGEEKIFIEINIIKNTILIRYTETIGNENMKMSFEKLKEHFEKNISDKSEIYNEPSNIQTVNESSEQKILLNRIRNLYDYLRHLENSDYSLRLKESSHYYQLKKCEKLVMFHLSMNNIHKAYIEIGYFVYKNIYLHDGKFNISELEKIYEMLHLLRDKLMEETKYFLEFLDELQYFLEHYTDSKHWSEWMKYSKEEYNASKSVQRFLSAFGGMGSFSDSYYEIIGNAGILHILIEVTLKFADSIRNYTNINIYDILDEIKKKYEITESEYNLNIINYINYLIENYKYTNLHEINNYYINQNSNNS